MCRDAKEQPVTFAIPTLEGVYATNSPATMPAHRAETPSVYHDSSWLLHTEKDHVRQQTSFWFCRTELPLNAVMLCVVMQNTNRADIPALDLRLTCVVRTHRATC